MLSRYPARFFSVANPIYVKNFGVVKKIEDLKNHHVIQYANVFGAKTAIIYPIFGTLLNEFRFSWIGPQSS